jgi:uncharacterized protein (TIGR00369 family)
MSEDRGLPKLTELAKIIGFEITEFSEGSCVVECTIREDHLNMGGVAHGGIHATLLDSAKEEWCATAQIDISYLNAVGTGTHLIATGEVIRRGRNLAHMEGRLTAEDGTLVATAKGIWAIWIVRSSPKRD